MLHSWMKVWYWFWIWSRVKSKEKKKKTKLRWRRPDQTQSEREKKRRRRRPVWKEKEKKKKKKIQTHQTQWEKKMVKSCGWPLTSRSLIVCLIIKMLLETEGMFGNCFFSLILCFKKQFSIFEIKKLVWQPKMDRKQKLFSKLNLWMKLKTYIKCYF